MSWTDHWGFANYVPSPHETCPRPPNFYYSNQNENKNTYEHKPHRYEKNSWGITEVNNMKSRCEWNPDLISIDSKRPHFNAVDCSLPCAIKKFIQHQYTRGTAVYLKPVTICHTNLLSANTRAFGWLRAPDKPGKRIWLCIRKIRK